MTESKVIDMTKIREQKDFEAKQKEAIDEQNTIMQPIYQSLMRIKNPKMAINAAQALITVGKDLLLLETGEANTKAFISNLKLDTAEMVKAQRQAESKAAVEDLKEKVAEQEKPETLN